MSTLSLINNLSLETLKYLEPEDLVLPQCSKKLEQLADDPMFDLEPGRAAEFYQTLNGLFRQGAGNLMTSPEAHNRLATAIWKLFWKGFSSLGISARKNLLGNNLIYALGQSIDVKTYLRKMLEVYESGFGPDKEERRTLIYSLEKSQEKLGQLPLMLEGKIKSLPTVENWIKNYNNLQPLTGGRTKFNQINFLNTSPESSKLSKKDKEILGKVLDIYDWLLFPPAGPQVVSDEEYAAAQATSSNLYMNQGALTLPEDVMRPVSPQEQDLPKFLLPNLPVPPQKRENVRQTDLSIDQPAQKIVLPKPDSSVVQDRQSQIDKKLEELKKKASQ